MSTQYQAPRAAREKEAEGVLAAMKARHPGAFPRPPRPLKIGIREDLIAAGWTEADVSAALGHYLKTEPYLRATYAEGAFRIDLNGCPTAPVQDHEAAWAREQVRWLPFRTQAGAR